MAKFVLPSGESKLTILLYSSGCSKLTKLL